MKNRFSIILSLCITLLMGILPSVGLAITTGMSPPPEPDEVWLMLNKEEQRLQVMLGDHAVVHYHNISWGRGGIGVKQRQGDRVTPVGSFRIRWINRDSKFRVFFGFDYPNPTYADIGLSKGALTPLQHSEIIKAWKTEKVPLQSTALGGALGIHGLGNADPEVHQNLNWTNGCIALNNAQIDHLENLVSIGTRVLINP